MIPLVEAPPLVQAPSAPAVSAALTDTEIRVSSGFRGARIVLYGAVFDPKDRPSDIVVIVRGPDTPLRIARKTQVAGLWLNSRPVVFRGAPGFYRVASTRPLQEMVTECMRGALADAGVAPHEVGLVLAHGTGTKANDPMECAALAEVFGPGAVPPVAAIKSMIGHTMGAAAAHACTAAVLAVQEGFLPPTINHRVLDPECPIDCVPNTSRAGRPDVVLVNALGFGGANAAVVLGRYTP